MSDHDPKPSGSLWMLQGASEPLSDAVVDAFLNGVIESDDARTERIRRVFVRRLLSQLHPEPVRDIERPGSFGRWIEAIRHSVGLTRADVAAAISDDADFVERVERTDVAPWTLKTSAVADLICLFRLHISAVEVLFVRSGAVIRGHHTTAASARSVTTDLTARGDSARKALDLYLATKATPATSDPLPQGVMDRLRRELEHREAFDLIGTAR